MASWSTGRRTQNASMRAQNDKVIAAARRAVAEVQAQNVRQAELVRAQSDEGAPFAVLFAVRLIVFLVAFAAFVRIGSALFN